MRGALVATGLAVALAVVACPGGHSGSKVEFPRPAEPFEPPSTLVLSSDWQRLHRIEHDFGEGGSFWASAPDSFSLLVTDSVSTWQEAAILELRANAGHVTFGEVFRYESNYAPSPRHLPDGTAFVDGFSNIGGDWNRTFWLDLDRSSHFVINCIQGYWTGHSLALPDDRLRSIFTLYPCSARTTADGTHCKRSIAITTRPGHKPEYQCLHDNAITVHPNHWHQSEDGRVAIGIGHYGGNFAEVHFAEDGGYESGRYLKLKVPPFSNFVPWVPIERTDGGTAFLSTVKWHDENNYAQRDVRLVYEDPGHPDANDAGVVAELIPHLPVESAPIRSYFHRPALPHRGAWVWITSDNKLHLLHPQTLELRVSEPLLAPTEASPRASRYNQLHSDGTSLYLMQRVREHPDEAAFNEWWVRVIDDWDAFFETTESTGVPP